VDLNRKKILETTDAKLTKQEVEQGYHFCPDWDYMVICPDDPEYEACLCIKTEG